MQKQLVIIGIIALLVCVGFSGCINDKSKFNGTWSTGSSYSTITFFSDGTCSYAGMSSGSWEIKDGKLVINGFGMSGTFEYSFSNNDNMLTITQVATGQITIFTKQ